MKSFKFSNRGPEVLSLAFGGWQASGWQSSNEEHFCDSLSFALDSGVNFIDTAPTYGKGISEELIGKTIENRDRSKLFIASKFNHYESSKGRVRLSLERSLRRLKTEYLDLFMQHWPAKKPPFTRIYDELLELKEEGKVINIGVCNWTSSEFEKSQGVELDFLQVCYGLLWRNTEEILSPNPDIKKIAYSPLAQGVLTNSYIPHQIPKDHREKNIYFKGEYTEQVAKLNEELDKIALKKNCTRSQVALAWVLGRTEFSAVVVGMSRKEQVVENLKALDIILDDIENSKLEELSNFSKSFEQYQTLWGWHSLTGNTKGA